MHDAPDVEPRVPERNVPRYFLATTTLDHQNAKQIVHLKLCLYSMAEFMGLYES